MDTSRVGSIKRCIYFFCDYIVKYPHRDVDQFLLFIYWLKMAVPKYRDYELSRIRAQILKIVPEKFKSAILSTRIISDYISLAKLSINGNYKANCPICLGEEIRDKSNHFPHIMFVPCGHSICERPCFDMFKKINDIDNHFICPLCRQKVTRLFDTDKSTMGREFYESFIIDELVCEILDFF